ncbi:MAG: energy-coupling factor transporter ATPase [Clostridiales bacterium]|nr:energy-coupling factor transporter ATPase [Clostridiales bacterium]
MEDNKAYKDNIIVAENVSYTYTDNDDNENNDTEAIKNLSCEIPRGKFTAIIGHNGSGKSTLAKLLSGIMVPGSGKVTVYKAGDKEGISSDDENNDFEIRKTVGMVFQNPDNQIVATIVEDDVAFAPENIGIEPKEIRRRVDEALKTVGLTEYALHDTHKLSGGQKQRVAIAGMLAVEPECIIFDESTAMLDPGGRKDIMNTILSLKDKGITVVLITHYMNEATRADNIIVVDHGDAILTGTPEEVFDNGEILKKCGLEAPQSTLVVQKLKADGINIKTKGVLDAQSAAKAIDEAIKAKKGVRDDA